MEKVKSDKKIKAAVLGGDARQNAVADALARIADTVTWGMPDGHINAIIAESWHDAVKDADLVVLPLPVTKDGIRLNAPSMSEPPEITEIIDKTKKAAIIAAGKVPPFIKKYAAESGVRIIDYFELEGVQIKNAVPTAEGAAEIAMHELPRTIMGAKAAVIGYGRVGRTLAQTMLSLKADVTCIARSERDLAWASVDGCKPMKLSAFIAAPAEFDVIFNTVPSPVITADVIGKLTNKPLIIDLAAAPGGTDFAAAADAGIKAQLASSLPGKTSPETAGEIIADAIISLLEQEAMI